MSDGCPFKSFGSACFPGFAIFASGDFVDKINWHPHSSAASQTDDADCINT